MSLDAKRCRELLAKPSEIWLSADKVLARAYLRDALELLTECKEVIKRTNADERSPAQKRLIHKLTEAGIE